jgi:hypothetical protein
MTMPQENTQKIKTKTVKKLGQSPKETKSENNPKLYCGIIMPISSIDGCNEQHWSDVREIVETAIADAGFEPRLVSDADEVGIIQKRIIQNVYDDPVVVCDVSGKNPNVMFELGMRLAFDKPTIIIKDDKTTYTFDTAPIEHLEYLRDLRFAKIVEFQENLAAKIAATHKKAQTDKNYTTFLKNFGSFSVAKLETKTLDKDDFILEELRSLKYLILRQPRALSESSPVFIEEDKDVLHSPSRVLIRRAIHRAISQIKPNLSQSEIRKYIMHEIIRITPEIKNFFSMSDYEKAIDRELKILGIFPYQSNAKKTFAVRRAVRT